VVEMHAASKNREKVEVIVLLVIIIVNEWQILVSLLSQLCWLVLTLVWLAIADSSMGLYIIWSD